MLAQVSSGVVVGIEPVVVRVEVDVARGLPTMFVVGLAEGAVREGRERVSAALANSGFKLAPRRITINLAPADLRKEGSAFDLPIAIGLLACAGMLSQAALSGRCFIGELGLDGAVRPVRGVLSIAELCAREGIGEIVVPAGNAAEAATAGGVTVRAVRTLEECVACLRGRPWPQGTTGASPGPPSSGSTWRGDFADVRGQQFARRALEIAAAGHHNVLLVGPPGSGKSLLARRVPSILPPLSRVEAIEVTKIHSVAGRLRPGQALVSDRPFRAPHHTISDSGLVGGGAGPRPGEASLAHHGVLFLDELPEFRRHVLDALRQPLEDGAIHIGRARFGFTFPARFMLVAAMNPCPCGFHGAGDARCVCNPGQVARYLARISGPLLDRIDMHVDVAPVPEHVLLSGGDGEPSAAILERVCAARQRQASRWSASPSEVPLPNAQLDARGTRELCTPDRAGNALLQSAVRRLRLSARGCHRVMRVARTIADLSGEECVGAHHLAEAIQYRSLERIRGPFVRAHART